MTNRIDKQIDLNASPARVWRALTDFREFGAWFGVRLEAPFEVGKLARGHITHPGYEHLVWEATVVVMETERLFSFTWHPSAVDPQVDYSQETPTLVEFRLEKTPTGTRLRLSESGFDKLPPHRFTDALRMNEGGWTQQMENIARHVES
jgi:uncharacterized protein YndB with AHSA1/START domain